MAVTRAKFKLKERHQFHWHPNMVKLVFEPEYDQSIPEDQRFARATPNGRFEMHVDNPAVTDNMKLGQTFYVDFTLVE